ncbi:YfcC family protein, partial [Photobacterium damselae]
MTTETAPTDKKEEKGGFFANFKLPSAYTSLFALIAVVALLTWIVPAGQYNR